MKFIFTKYFLLILLSFAIAACATKPVKKKSKSSKKYTLQKSLQKTVQPTRGFLVEGKDQDLAINSLYDQIIDLSEDEIVVINDGKVPPYYNRLLNAKINENATVAQVNQALKNAGVLISFSEERIPQVTLLIPPPGGMINLKKYQKLLEKSKAFDVVVVEVPEDSILQ